uniref:Glutamyl-tRNA synthetase n=2 Tax=Clytia hemisphaerica TaxID=252671 RepID=A0A7M5TTE7_9CNID
MSTYLVGQGFTLADFAIWAALKDNSKWSASDDEVSRWFKFASENGIFKAVSAKTTKSSSSNQGGSKKGDGKPLEEGGKFIDLPGAEMGKVVTRFPPEASGYLHIGHAKAALLNQAYKEIYDGKLIMRFDDTNPAKENAHFEQIILEDIKLLKLTPDMYSRTSDHFDKIEVFAEQLIRQGDAYCDCTPSEEMRKCREERQASIYRDQTPEEAMRIFQEMKKGSPEGLANCLRGKVDYASDNGCMRDPVLYRCRNEEHISTGDKYKAYPTYDFACPIVDSVEGVTHTMRTSEYDDRDVQYFWMLEKLGLRKPMIYSYSRLNLINTVLSKRKLTYLVDEGLVDGWDDPRFPTVRGVLRRGLTIPGLIEFIKAQGASKANVVMGWDKIWAFNKKMIDPVAPRYNALLKNDVVPVNVNNANESSTKYPRHPKNEEVGEKNVYYSSKVFMEGEDAAAIKEGDLVTFINWGNLRIKGINKEGDKVVSVDAVTELDNKDFKKTLKVTWLAEHSSAPFVPTKCFFFDNIITKDVLGKDDNFKDFIGKDTKRENEMLGDPELKNLKKGDIIQIQRRGYFICDQPYEPPSRHSGRESPCMLFHIPDGSTAGMMNQKNDKKNASGGGGGGSNSSATARSNKKKQQKQTSPQKESKANLSTSATTAASDASGHTPEQQKLYDSVTAQGDKIRSLKAEKAAKDAILAEVTVLKDLKAQYKAATGREYVAAPTANTSKPVEKKMAPVASTTVSLSPEAESVVQKITEQGNKIRDMKTNKAAKEALQPEIDQLLKLKSEYKAITGSDYQAPGAGSSKKDKKSKENKQPKQPKEKKEKAKKEKAAAATTPDDGQKQKQTRLGVEFKKAESLPDWYSQVITKSEMIEYYDVSGCYILRPWAYSIWERIKAHFDGRIRDSGVENCYFPMFVSHSALEKEKEHIADFAPEVAWVTKSGQSELAEPIAIRPTSETVMYPAYAKWVQSHRDLPLRLNQWCNVVRWEFKHPQPFLRTREFLWQEGHSAFATRKEATDEVYEILDYYAEIYTDLLAIPVVKGKKTEKEKFAGGDFTTTVEAYIEASGRAIQGATSHHLGQNFSKMFGITFEDPNNAKEKMFVHQNSWGITTRTIGVLVMVHGDDKGLVLPPKVANYQVVLVPIMTAQTPEDKKKIILDACQDYKKTFAKAGIRSTFDSRDNYTPGWKFNHWEMKGVPLRVELGPRDIDNHQMVVVRRDTGEKITMKQEGCVDNINKLLDNIQANLYAKASKELESNIIVTKSFDEFKAKLDEKKLIQAPFCGAPACEDKIKKDSAREETEAGAPSMGAKSLCIPFKQPAEIKKGDKCICPGCECDAEYYTLFGRSY